MARLIRGIPASGLNITSLATDAHKTFIYIVSFLGVFSDKPGKYIFVAREGPTGYRPPVRCCRVTRPSGRLRKSSVG